MSAPQMTDRELLELAAKAAGLKLAQWHNESWLWLARDEPLVLAMEHRREWKPLHDDGDALRLAVKVLNWPHGGRAFDNAVTAMFAVGQLPLDSYAATRRAIVCAAAEIGRAMP